MKKNKPIVLIILDGWGYRENPEFNAIYSAQKPNWDRYWSHYPHTLVSGSGNDVGLPDGQMGNSEVGHLHMGAGRLVPQDLMRIDLEIKNGHFFKNQVLINALNRTKEQNTKLHIFGLLSPGGVHSHENHLAAIIEMAAKQGCSEVYLHAILDGRDTPPRSALSSIAMIEKKMKEVKKGKIASLVGRYYAMDRDQRWERVHKAYNLYTIGQTNFHATTAASGLELAYERNESDEFVQPTAIHPPEKEPITIDDGDVVIFMNFRADRARQLTHAFTDDHFDRFSREKVVKLKSFVTLTNYASNIKAQVAYLPIEVTNSLGEYVSKNDLTQLRIAETEKYAHVTFFFNGGKEQPFPGEDRILVPSSQVATYDLKPEMSAFELTDKLVEDILLQKHDLIICNFANPDMVGHTGNMGATIEAIEIIDQCLAKIVSTLQTVGGEAIITSDHGNAEFMFNNVTKQPHTAHTENLVPFIYIGRPAEIVSTKNSTLIDIAPTILYLLNLPLPSEMQGNSIIKFTNQKMVAP